MKRVNLIFLQIFIAAVSVIGINIISSDMKNYDRPSNAVLVYSTINDKTKEV